MNFNEYRLTKDCNPPPAVRDMSAKDYYMEMARQMHAGRDMGKLSDMYIAEAVWVMSRRPFYHVYPAVVTCLKNTSLDLRPSQLGVLETTAICFAAGHEPQTSSGKVAAMLFEVSQQARDIQTGLVENHPVVRIAVDIIKPNGDHGASLIFTTSDEPMSAKCSSLGDKKALLSLAVGIALLAKDERFAEPILLQRDQGRKFASQDDYNRAIERAKNRGRNGVAIGKHLEISPHIRRPHMAIRWTEKGRSVPRLVPVKGCVVSRDKLFPIPTGHMDHAPPPTDAH